MFGNVGSALKNVGKSLRNVTPMGNVVSALNWRTFAL